MEIHNVALNMSNYLQFDEDQNRTHLEKSTLLTHINTNDKSEILSTKSKQNNQILTETREHRSTRNSPIKRKSINYYPNKKSRSLTFKRKNDTNTIMEEHANKGLRTSPIKRKRVNYKPHTYQKNTKGFNNFTSRQQNILKQNYFPLYTEELDGNPNNSFEILDPNEMDFQKLYLKRQERHIHLREGDFSFNDLEDNPLINAATKINDALMNLKLSDPCKICNESWYDLELGKNNKMCSRCSRENKNTKIDPNNPKILTFSSKNDMHPDIAPECIQKLSFIELASIKLVQPMFHIVKTKGGSLKMKGHSIALEQDISEFATRLPHSPDQLPIIILRTRNEKNPKKFKANRNNILEALKWLKIHNQYYKKIEIDESALQQYPLNGGDVEGIPEEFSDDLGKQNEPRNPSMQNEMDEINEIIQNEFDMSDDMPPPESTVQQNFPKPTIMEAMKHITNNVTIGNDLRKENNSHTINEILCPQQSKQPVSEFSEGFFTKAWVELFPTGKGDITLPHKGKTPSELQWLRHLLRLKDRRFANHPTFIMYMVNRIQRHQALSVGNVYAKRSCPDISLKDLQENINNGDLNTLRNLYYFGKNIKGSPQYFNSQATISLNFLRHLRISSEDLRTYNLFLTWSAADYHWPELHRLFPNHEEYLGKKVVKSLSDIPPGHDESQYIDKKKDILLRMKNVHENSDIVNWFFKKKFQLLVEHVFPIIKITDFIARSEFQGRGSIHIHAILAVDGNVTPKDLELAIKSTQYPDEPCEIQINEGCIDSTGNIYDENQEFQSNKPSNDRFDNGSDENIENDNPCNNQNDEASDNTNKISENENLKIAAEKKVCDFAVNHIGLTTLHPNHDPMQWPERMPYATDNQCLRLNIKDICDPKEISQIYESIINIVQIHTCTQNYCLCYDKRDKETNEPNCRFHFPKDIHGFNTDIDDQNRINSLSRMRVDQESYKDKAIKYKHKEEKRVAPDGASIINNNICPIRNHHRIVQHIKEMPIIWGANTEAQVVTSWRKLLMYIVKYVMKAEKPSDAFQRIAKELLQKEGEDTPARKLFSRLLINSLGTDKSRAECFLIALDGDYVQFSQRYEWVNLNGSKRLKLNVSSEDDLALETTDWLHIYAERDQNKNFIEICNIYPEKFKWKCHPNDISLRDFVTYFDKNWMVKDTITVPIFSPTQKFNVKKKHKSYENWCKFTLLSEKPGCYITNVGKEYPSFEEELRNFVLHSKFCPPLIKQEFEESQLESDENLHDEDISEDEQLLVSPLQNPEGEDMDPSGFQMYQPHDDIVPNMEKDDDAISDYDAEEFINDAFRHDWDLDLNTLQHDMPEKIDSAPDWLENEKVSYVSKKVDSDEVDPKSCNNGQAIFYEYISKWVQSKLDNPDELPIYLLLSGRAGCGKTFAVKCVKKFINEKCKEKEGFIRMVGHKKEGFLKMAAPTGTASFLIKGDTLHSLFKLPVNIPFNKELTPLKGPTLHDLQEMFKNTELLIIDEMSMVGQYMLYQISKRLQEAKPHKSTIAFGGVSIVLMGDFAQLPPVTDLSLFQNTGGSPYQLIGRCLYRQYFNKTLTLTDNMRQKGKDQEIFRNILDSIAMGTFNEDTWEELKKHSFTMQTEEGKCQFKDAVKLCAINKDSTSFNIQKIKELKNPIAPIKAVNSSAKAKKFPANKAGGLRNNILICKGSKVMLLSNLWNKHGLTNGANGIVRYIVYEKDKKPPSLPSFVLVYFPDYTGPSFHDSEEKLVPIVPITRKWFESKAEHYRTMLPLVPSYAITIHKSQGQTLKKIILSLGNKEFAPGLTYTALSRTTHIDRICFDRLPPVQRFTNMFISKRFKNRLEEEKRLLKLSIK